MSYAQLTPEQPSAEPDGHEGETDELTPARHADELRLAQARRLEMLELERASDEGMTAPAPPGLRHADDEDDVDDQVAPRRSVEQRPDDSDPE